MVFHSFPSPLGGQSVRNVCGEILSLKQKAPETPSIFSSYKSTNGPDETNGDSRATEKSTAGAYTLLHDDKIIRRIPGMLVSLALAKVIYPFLSGYDSHRNLAAEHEIEAKSPEN